MEATTNLIATNGAHMAKTPKFKFHVYSLTEGNGWYWTPWADGACKPVHGPYASKRAAMEAVIHDGDFSEGDNILLSDRR
jgi:hypothetical protein